MKKLFIVAFASWSAIGLAAPPKTTPPPKPSAIQATPERPKERKPGFWERAWKSSGKGTQRIGRTITRPFRKGEEKPGLATGWRNLALSLTLDPPAIKLGDTRAVKVGLIVVNKGKETVQLEFPTTQRIEVLLKSGDGQVISKWSEDQKVDPEEGFLVVNPEERLEYSATVSTREMKSGNTYIIEAYFPQYDQMRASRVITPTN